MTPESPPLILPRVCAGDSRLGPGGLPTLQLLAAPGLQLTPQGQGPITPMWPLETGSPETSSLHGCPGQGAPAQVALLGLGAAGCSGGSEHFVSPQMPTQCKSPASEEIQEGNRSGCQCPGERLAPQPPGPRSPAAVLTVPPQSTGGQRRACLGASRTVAPPAGVGVVGGVENKVVPQQSYQPHQTGKRPPRLAAPRSPPL